MSVEFVGVTFGYTQTQPVISNLSFKISQGSTNAIVGPSGSGKSTILSLIGRLINPQAGHVILNQIDNKTDIGWVFQGMNVLGNRTVLDNASLGLLSRGDTREMAYPKVVSTLASVGLSEYVSRPIESLSGGQIQRVCVARALSMEPRILIADEPTGQLDIESSEMVTAALTSSSKALGVTLVVATHDMTVANSCDTVIDLKAI